MAVADGAILRIVASLLFPSSVIAQNVFYAVFADTGTSDDEQDVVDDLGEWIEDMYAQLNSYIPVDVELTGIKVYNYDSIDDDWDEVGDFVTSDSWVASGDMLAHGVAAVLHAKTTDPDVQATKYLGGLVETATTKGIWSAGALTALGNFATDWTASFVGTITGADFGPGVWSVANTNFFLFNQVEIVNSFVGYQRRRKPGVGI